MGVNLQPPDYTPTNWKGFFIKAIFPRPELFAMLIQMVDSGSITRATARKLITDYCEHRRDLVDKILEDE